MRRTLQKASSDGKWTSAVHKTEGFLTGGEKPTRDDFSRPAEPGNCQGNMFVLKDFFKGFDVLGARINYDESGASHIMRLLECFGPDPGLRLTQRLGAFEPSCLPVLFEIPSIIRETTFPAAS